MFKPIDRALVRIAEASSAISVLAIALMMIHVTVDVAGRFLLNSPAPGTITIVSHYYMVAVGFLGLAITEARGAHITVEIVADLAPAPARRVMHAAARLISAAAFALVAVRGWEVAMGKTTLGASVQQGSDTIPVWITYWAVPLGAGLMAVVALSRFIAALTGSDEADGTGGNGDEDPAGAAHG